MAYGNMYSPTIAGPDASRSLPSYESIFKPENAKTSGGFGIYGPISGALQIAQGVMGYETQRQRASGFGDTADELLRAGRLALEQGLETAIDIGRAGESFVGEITAAFGKSGSLLEGSPLLVLADTQAKIERNMQRVIDQAREAYRQYYLQAKKAKKAEKSAERSGFASLGSALGGVAGGFLGGPLGAIAGSQAGGFGGQLLG